MFVHHGNLDHLLEPAAYYEPGWFAREQEAIFQRGWNYFCLAQEVASHGCRLARAVSGVPVVVINHQGKLHALQNVCAHRHSVIVPEGCSRAERLQCQIHGWEYDHTGRVSKMPDGRSFLGVKAQEFCLQRYRVETAGPFVFVSLAEAGPSFRDHLGTLTGEFDRFYEDLRHIDTWISEHPVNWKIICENAVESYHVPMVHPGTYQDYRPEEQHDHRLDPTCTRYADLYPYERERSLEARGFRLYTRLLIRNPTYQRFTHVHLFPAFLLYFGDIYANLAVVEPLGPERTRFTLLSFVPRAIRWGWAGRALQSIALQVFLRMARKIVGEDVARWPPVQAGLKQSPHRGVLGAREERVHAFQQYVLRQVRPDTPLPVASPSE